MVPGLVALALSLAACAAPAPEVGRATATRPVAGSGADLPATDDGTAARAVAARARAAEVVYLGELHDNLHHHAVQRRVIEAMVEAGLRPAVAFEMVTEVQQEELDDVLARASTESEVERRLRWTARGWPTFAMYWPILDLARRERLPAVATDLDPAVSRLIARGGLSVLGEGAGELASRLPADAARERTIAETIQRAHCDLLPERRLPTMVESWHARNVTIARRLTVALGRAVPVVVIIGRGHQAAGGVPDQLEVIRPGTRQLVVDLVEAPPGQPLVVASNGAGRISWPTLGPTRSDMCEGLRRRGITP